MPLPQQPLPPCLIGFGRLPPAAGDCLILDPCAGEGHALLQLAQGLHAVPYGIELSEDRAALVRESLPEGHQILDFPLRRLREAVPDVQASFRSSIAPYLQKCDVFAQNIPTVTGYNGSHAFRPLYEVHHQRYSVYWRLREDSSHPKQ